MNYFEFEYPLAFALLLMIICIYKCPKTVKELIFPHIHLFSNATSFLQKDKLLYSLILALLATALASPISYERKFSDQRKGRDLVFALDASGSMAESGFDKENAQKKKFDILKDLLKEFVSNRYDDNVGVSIFGSYAYSGVPLTYDMASVEFLLDFFEVGIAGDSTAIGEGLASATRLLKKGEAKNKVIVLVTDGYQNSGAVSVKDAALNAKALGIKIYSIGIGKQGAFDHKLLSQIATDTNAKSYKAANAETLKNIYADLNALEPSDIHSERYLNKIELYALPLSVASLLLAFLLLRYRERER